jgi:hypothetical protein
LGRLNEISNAYKHSFINSEVTLLGRDEPVVFALALKYNRLDKSPQFHSVALSDVVQQFSGFYERAVGSIGQLSSRVKASHAAESSGAANIGLQPTAAGDILSPPRLKPAR